MDMMASAFAGFPRFSPGMMVNRSETCATRKLKQCTDFGVHMNDVSQKFAGTSAPDLTPADFRARKSIVQQVARWNEANANATKSNVYRDEYAPILYKYEIVKTSAKTERDWGHMLFTDMTISQFLLVMIFPAPCNCGNLAHHDYDALTRYHADRMMSLLIYLNEEWGWGNKPAWVQATYVTPKEAFKVSSDFLNNIGQTPGESRKAGRPPIYVVTPDNFKPTLLPSELEKVDNTIARGATSNERQSSGAREKVLGSKEDKPDVSSALKGKNQRECAFCKTVKNPGELSRCSGCMLTWYCGKECQRAAWPYHKVSCRKAKPRAET